MSFHIVYLTVSFWPFSGYHQDEQGGLWLTQWIFTSLLHSFTENIIYIYIYISHVSPTKIFPCWCSMRHKLSLPNLSTWAISLLNSCYPFLPPELPGFPPKNKLCPKATFLLKKVEIVWHCYRITYVLSRKTFSHLPLQLTWAEASPAYQEALSRQIQQLISGTWDFCMTLYNTGTFPA